MFKIAIVLFALAAIAGVTMAIMHFRGRTPPDPVLAAFHGLFAASGLLALILAVMRIGLGGAAGIALGLFVIAALGGFVLLTFHMRRRALPGALVIGHGLLAVAGFLALLAAAFAMTGQG